MDKKKEHSFAFKDQLNSSLYSFGSPAKSQLKSIKSLFASFGLTPPQKLCKSGSNDSLWFSTKYEKKMAALEDDAPLSPRFQRSVPLRQSKLIAGPFRATQIWNEVIEHLKERVDVKKRRSKLRNYDDCFTGTDAVDVVLHYLLSDQDTFCNLSREKAVKLCQTLMDKNVFKPVGCKLGDTTPHDFEDSSGKLYHFVGIHSNKENGARNESDSDNETEGRNEMCESIIEEGANVNTPAEQIRINNVDVNSDLVARAETSSPMTTTAMTKSAVVKDIPEKRTMKRKTLDGSQRSTKRQRMCSSSEAINEAPLSNHSIQEIWKEVALCDLLTIVELSFLDGVLTEETEKEKHCKKVIKPYHHSGVVSDMAAKHWNFTCTTSSASHSDPFMRVALECIAHIPRGVSKFDTDFTKSSDAVTKLQAYNMICEHYFMRMDSLFPERFLDINSAIMKHVISGHEDKSLHAMQLNMILLPARIQEELRRLLKFMAAAADDTELQLHEQYDNVSMVLTNFTDCIVKHKGMAWNVSSVLVTFLMQHVEQIFTIPAEFREKVDKRIREIRDGVVPVVKETTFCSQLTSTEYQRQTEECTNNGLVQMMNSIIDNSNMSLKDKKQSLRQFRKYHPHIYAKHFIGMVK